MSANLIVLVVALLGYGVFQFGRSLRDEAAVPHWTTAVAVGTAVLLLEGHALTLLLNGSAGWTYQLLGIAGFALIGPVTIAWSIIGALWLRHRGHTVHRPRHARSASGVRTVTN
ncbi:hypothetical protein [Cryptosporangium sp. NPDC048952]|uniref:hypothetical protein n=1 Tax=Cryptosporangium sp. NPDC048952 TaxID=3363961 RepID=UPI00371188B6